MEGWKDTEAPMTLKDVFDTAGPYGTFQVGPSVASVTDQAVADEVKRVYAEQLDIYTQALDKGEQLKNSLLLTGPTSLTVKQKVKVCLAKRESLTADAERMLRGVFEILEDNAAVPGRFVIQPQLDMLKEVNQKMLEAEKMTSEAVEMDFGQAATYRADGRAKGMEVGE